ncbi:MAG: hypothetical protein LIP16_17990 [Clostridium sp.]|nr:hypothetical protein [Clostridium sp.]
MAMLIGFIPKGYSDEQKERFLKGCEKCETLGLKLSPNFEHVYLHEFDRDHCDEMMQKSKIMLCYTAEGKGLINKAEFVQLFKETCDDSFGPGETENAIVYLEEHENPFISVEGLMRCEDKEMMAYLASLSQDEG